MSMSSYVVAFRQPDESFKKMLAVYNACNDAGVDLPKDVSEFFDEPDPKGIEIKIDDAVESWNDGEDGMSEGFQIDIDKLPKGVKYIRFYNSY